MKKSSSSLSASTIILYYIVYILYCAACMISPHCSRSYLYACICIVHVEYLYTAQRAASGWRGDQVPRKIRKYDYVILYCACIIFCTVCIIWYSVYMVLCIYYMHGIYFICTVYMWYSVYSIFCIYYMVFCIYGILYILYAWYIFYMYCVYMVFCI